MMMRRIPTSIYPEHTSCLESYKVQQELPDLRAKLTELASLTGRLSGF